MELETSSNPFAVMTQAHLKAQETAGSDSERYRAKLGLIRSLLVPARLPADGDFRTIPVYRLGAGVAKRIGRPVVGRNSTIRGRKIDALREQPQANSSTQ